MTDGTKIKDLTEKTTGVATDEFVINDVANSNADKKLGMDGIRITRSQVTDIFTICKPADEIVDGDGISNVLQDDDDFKFDAEASATYNILIHCIWKGTAVANVKNILSVPTGATGQQTETFTLGVNTAALTSEENQGLGGGNGDFGIFMFTVVMDTTAGEVVFQWHQNTAEDTNLSLKAGSIMTVCKSV